MTDKDTARPGPQATETQPPQRDQTIPLAPGSRSRPVLLYIGIMFSVALILLLLSFLMQQRNHEALMEGLTDLGDLQSMVELKLENQNLQESLAQSGLDLAALQEAYEGLSAQEEAAVAQTRALSYLTELRHAYDLGHNRAARAIVAEFEETGLPQALPETSPVEGAASPAQLYADIKEALF